MEKCIVDRNEDEWAVEVKGRVASILCLRAEEAVYHLNCNTRFRNKKRNPKSTVIGEKRGRPPDLTREAAFIEVANYLKENDEEQLTLSDLQAMMANMLPEQKGDAYCTKWLQEKLLTYFKDQIVISNIQGKPNVVTFISTANKILADFHSNRSSDDANVEKLRVIKAAEELIKIDIKSLPVHGVYPTVEELATFEGCLEYVPFSLRNLLEHMFVGKDKSRKVSFIGQAIMQQIRPRVFLAPLQVGVAVQMHHQFASRFLNDSLNAMGFASSYSEVSKFERNAAVMKGTDIKGLNDGSFIQHVADNVDHNIRTLDGLNTFHGMGIIAAVTPGNVSRERVPRLTVSSDEVLKIGNIEILFLYTR